MEIMNDQRVRDLARMLLPIVLGLLWSPATSSRPVRPQGRRGSTSRA